MTKQIQKIAYKLLVDILSLTMLVFAANLLAEGLAPGYLSGYLSFTKLTGVVFLLLVAIIYLGKRIDISFAKKPLDENKFLVFSAIMGLALIVNSSRNLSWIEIGITSASMIFIAFYLYQILFPSTND